MEVLQKSHNNYPNHNDSKATIISTNCATINCNNNIINNRIINNNNSETTAKERQNKMNNNNNNSSNKTRLVRLRREAGTQLGFSIRGGWEHGTGIFVSDVRSGLEAAKQGLQVGDQILRINGFSLEHAIHDEVIALIKSSLKLTLKVKSVGMIPVKERTNDILTWHLLSNSVNTSPSLSHSSSDSHSDSEHDFLEEKIFIDLKGRPLGCSVVKGPNSNSTGIYVQSVKIGEIAAQCGLQVGDQIIEVNGTNVSHMEFTDAICTLKSLSSMALTVKKGAGKHLFCVAKNGRHFFTVDSNLVNSADTAKKKVTAMIHNHNNGRHARMLSSSSNCSETSSSSGGKNCNYSDNDYSISEMETSDAGSANTTANHIGDALLASDSAVKILEKVKLEEERLADERRKLEEEQQKLKLEMQKLELQKKELEKRKQLDECQSLSNCSISSTSASSSGSQSICFLEEIKMMGDNGRRNLKPINNSLADRANNNKNAANGDKLKLPVLTKCDNNSEKHKQHELLMEEFRRAHKKMFGQNMLNSDDSLIQIQTVSPLLNLKDKLKETKSLPTTATTTTAATIVATKPATITPPPTPFIKTPPAVPIKKSSIGAAPQSQPVVTIGTYVNSTINKNRFAPQNHRSVIQVRRDDSDESSTDANSVKSSISNSAITIKVISPTKQQ